MTYVYLNDVRVHSYLIDQNSRCFSAIEGESSGISFFVSLFFLSRFTYLCFRQATVYLPSTLCAFHTSSKPPEDLSLSN